VLYNSPSFKKGGIFVNCMKCGREIAEDQVFCESCLEVMRKYPVKPGIAIQLPQRKETPFVKKVQSKRRHAPTPEERIQVLKKRVRTLVILWLVTLALLAAALYPALEYFQGRRFHQTGQNYSTFTDSTESTR